MKSKVAFSIDKELIDKLQSIIPKGSLSQFINQCVRDSIEDRENIIIQINDARSVLKSYRDATELPDKAWWANECVKMLDIILSLVEQQDLQIKSLQNQRPNTDGTRSDL